MANDDHWQPPTRVPECDIGSLIAGYERALRPPIARDIAIVLGRLAGHYQQPDRPDGAMALLYEDWIADLSEFPVGVIVEATDQWRRTEKWAPKVCELRSLCEEITSRRRTELIRLRFLDWCVQTHAGACPRLLRRIGDRLVDYRDPASSRLLEAAMRGQTELGGDLVLALPGAALALPRPDDPVIVAYRERVRDILAAAGYSATERLQLGDVTEERATALATERTAERERQRRRQHVLRILIAGGLAIPEIERRGLLDLGEDEARQLAEERARVAAAIAAAEAAAPASGTVQ